MELSEVMVVETLWPSLPMLLSVCVGGSRLTEMSDRGDRGVGADGLMELSVVTVVETLWPPLLMRLFVCVGGSRPCDGGE